MNAADNLGQMRKEIERLADGIERLELALANRQDTTDAILHELQATAERLEDVSQVIDGIRDDIEPNYRGGRGLLSRLRRMFRGEPAEYEDQLYQRARECVIEAGKASTSFLQRRLGVGYSRAARLIDMLEDRGVIGPQRGAEPRRITLREQGNHTTEKMLEALQEAARQNERSTERE